MDEQRRSPIKVILWVLTGCVVFVAAGLYLTRPPSNAEEWDAETDDDVTAYDTFEEAWNRVWTGDESSQIVESKSTNDEATDVVSRAKNAKAPNHKTEEKEAERAEERTANTTVTVDRTSPLGASDDGTKGPPMPEGESSRSDDARDDVAADDTEPASSSELSVAKAPAARASTTATPPTKVSPDLTTIRIARPVAKVTSSPVDVDEEFMAGPQPVESRVVTLRLTGSIAGKRLDPKNGYAWGRLAYFFQRERNPPYFLVFPGGGLSGVMRPPATSGGRPVGRQTVQGLPSLRPRARLGSPLFVINLMAVFESVGAVTFYGRGIAQKYRCRVNAQVVYLGGDQPQVVDSFTVSETATAVQGRVATGPPGGAIYQAAIEKLIARLRATTYFR